jgi:hypothetical protein
MICVWVHYHNLATKQNIMQWKQRENPPPQKVNIWNSVSEITAILF